jgi:hypothetical protein
LTEWVWYVGALKIVRGKVNLMLRKICALLCAMNLLTLPAFGGWSQANSQTAGPQNIALVNGQWFNGKSFEPRTFYSVKGRFASKRPARVARTLDLAGRWIVPPFAEAHNHSIGSGIEEQEKKSIRNFLGDGVF